MEPSELNEFNYQVNELELLVQMLKLAHKGHGPSEIARSVQREQSFVSRFLPPLDIILKQAARKGNRLSDKALQFVAALEHVIEVLKESIGPKRFGTVHFRIGSIPSVHASFMPAVIARLANESYFQKNPEVALHLESHSASSLFEKLDQDLLDLVIAYPHRDTTIFPEDNEETNDWALVKMSPWIYSKDVHYLGLFQGLPVGLIFHPDNKLMQMFRRRPETFTFKELESQSMLLTSDPSQPAFETEIEKCLPTPKAGAGTRIYFQTFNQIRAVLTQTERKDKKNSHDSIQLNGVGIGVKGDDLDFLNFADVLKKIKPDSPDFSPVRHLANLSVQSFFAYRKLGKARLEVRTTLFQEIFLTVAREAKGYLHPYVA